MGVPGLFLWLVKNYGSDNLIVNKESIKYVDSLFIDTNCLLHPQCFKVLDNYNGSIDKLEEIMIKECINYIDYLINFVVPKKLVYISIDGTAPFAKIKQQKLRRFKSAKDIRLYNNLKKKHNKINNKLKWSNSCITPGTEFMENLHIKILDYIELKRNESTFEIIYSSCYSPSEGEHKILQYVKKKDFNNYIIYGLDADLIFLSLASQKENVFLLRETNILKNKEKESLSLISIDSIINYLVDEFKLNITNKQFIIKKNLIIDFIFICFFLGNDFLPHIPSIDINADKSLINGIDLLIYCYCKTFNNFNNYIIKILDKNLYFNEEVFIDIIDNLILFENDFLKKSYLIKKNKRYCKSSDNYDKEIFKIENLQFKINDSIKLGKDTEDKWKHRYYCKNYNIIYNYDKTVLESCKCYIDGMIWNAYYYFQDCKSWSWYFKYNHAPFISDIRKYIKSFELNKITFKIDKPLKPLHQLLAVLPPQYAYLLPKSYKYLTLNDNSPLIYLYPRDFELDMINKKKYWQCLPIIPMINYNQLNIAEKFKLSEKEEYRNRIEELF